MVFRVTVEPAIRINICLGGDNRRLKYFFGGTFHRDPPCAPLIMSTFFRNQVNHNILEEIFQLPSQSHRKLIPKRISIIPPQQQLAGGIFTGVGEH